MTYVHPDKTSVYRASDRFDESGDVSHTANNATDKPVVLLNFELVHRRKPEAQRFPCRK